MHELIVKHVARGQEEQQEYHGEDRLGEIGGRHVREARKEARLTHDDLLHVFVPAAGRHLVDLLAGFQDRLGRAEQAPDLLLYLTADRRSIIDQALHGRREQEHAGEQHGRQGGHADQGRQSGRNAVTFEETADRAEDQGEQEGEDDRHQELAGVGNPGDQQKQEDADDGPARHRMSTQADHRPGL